MTTINIIAKKTGLSAPQLHGAARFTAQAFNANGPYVQVDGEAVIFPALITVEMVNGVPQTPINLPPTDGTFYYKMTVQSYDRPFLISRNVAVPNSGSVDFEDLVDVDPDTFQPSPSSTAAWQAAIASVQAVQADIDGLALQAQVSALQAADSLTEAEKARVAAEAARDEVLEFLAALRAESSGDPE